jgi:hypothetical protein
VRAARSRCAASIGGIAIGQSLGGSGFLTVTGASSLLNEGSNGNGIGIGEVGPGTMDLLSGGAVTIATHVLSIGTTSAGTGTVLVSGSDSTIDVQGTTGVITFNNIQFTGTARTFTIGTDGPSSDAYIQASAPCFVAGTRVATIHGEIASEDLRVGDTVLAVLGDDAEPIIWIGRRQVDCTRHPRPHLVWPVRIGAGAFGVGLPFADLLLSPDHAIYINKVLVPVTHLVNGSTTTQSRMDRVTYFHIELPQHDMVLAHGLSVESFLDVKDRSDYANGSGPMKRHPDF